MSNNETYLQRFTGYIKAHPFKVVFVILWAFFVYRIIMAGYAPDYYAIQFMDQPDTDNYPINLVINMNAIMLLHLILIALADQFIKSRKKYLVMLIITFVLLCGFGPMMMHAPQPLAFLVLWLLIAFAYMLLACIWKVCRYFYN